MATTKFDIFEDEQIKKSFYTDRHPNEYQEAILKVFEHQLLNTLGHVSWGIA